MKRELVNSSGQAIRRLVFLLVALGFCRATHAQTADPFSVGPERLRPLVGSYEGTLNNKYRIRMQLSLADSVLTGQYYYQSQGKLLQLRGHLEPNGSVVLRESFRTDTTATGWFALGPGQFAYNEPLIGHWYNKSGTVLLPFQLTRVSGAAVPAVAKARVVAKTYFKSYQIPIATVPDAGVTKVLASWFSLENLANESVQSLQDQLREEREEQLHYGLQDLRYEVGYNARSLLSITTSREGVGASIWHDYQTQTIDLATGFPVQVLDELQPELLPKFYALGQRKLRARVEEYLKEQEYGSKESLLDENDAQGLRGLRFGEITLREFTIEPGGLQFDHPASYDGLSNFIFKMMQGSFTVTFTHAELARFLKPDSVLRRLSKP